MLHAERKSHLRSLHKEMVILIKFAYETGRLLSAFGNDRVASSKWNLGCSSTAPTNENHPITRLGNISVLNKGNVNAPGRV